MAKHKHSPMIKAKVDNMDLVVFLNSGQEWTESSLNTMVANSDIDFFLCLPQYKETCLHWLNGGEVEINATFEDDEWVDYDPVRGWSTGSVFMQCDHVLRAKPRKEKLWIAVKTDKHETLGGCRNVRICSHAFVNKQDAIDYLNLDSSQLVEIEVEA